MHASIATSCWPPAARARPRFVPADFAAIAQQAGSVISAALFGALASTGALPFQRSAFEEAIRRGGVGVERSLAAFAAGFETDRAAPKKPLPLPDIVDAGVQRLTEYQDERTPGFTWSGWRHSARGTTRPCWKRPPATWRCGCPMRMPSAWRN